LLCAVEKGFGDVLSISGESVMEKGFGENVLSFSVLSVGIIKLKNCAGFCCVENLRAFIWLHKNSHSRFKSVKK
jgi:hypothetical protein